jgi:hypothetical protein
MALRAALVGRGVPAEMTETVALAIDSAGLGLGAKDGARAAAVHDDALMCTVFAVEGRPGVHVVEVSLGGGKTVRWVEFTAKDGSVERLPG